MHAIPGHPPTGRGGPVCIDKPSLCIGSAIRVHWRAGLRWTWRKGGDRSVNERFVHGHADGVGADLPSTVDDAVALGGILWDPHAVRIHPIRSTRSPSSAPPATLFSPRSTPSLGPPIPGPPSSSTSPGTAAGSHPRSAWASHLRERAGSSRCWSRRTERSGIARSPGR